MSEPLPGRGILVVGDVMTDIIVRPDGALRRGSDRAAVIRSRPGGSGANQAVWLGSLGGRVRFAARVGAADVAALDEYFRQFGVETRLAADRDLPSGVLVTMLDADGERSFLTDRGANLRLDAGDLGEALLEDVGVLGVSGYSFFAEGPRAAVLDLVARAQRRGVRVAVDPASVGFLEEVGIGNFLAWTEGADWLFANAEEAAALSGRQAVGEQVAMLARHYRRVVVKGGAAGAAVGGMEGIAVVLPAQQVECVDTTGAGDAFAAGFLVALMAGAEEAECLAAGIAAGARAVRVVGGQPAFGQVHPVG